LVSWRDDVQRLHSIASHARLRNSIHSVTFNFSKVDEYNARHASFFQHWVQEPEERNTLLQEAWARYYTLEARGRGLPTFASQAAAVVESLRRLPKLKDLEVTYTKCPYDIDVLKEAFLVRNCRKRDRTQACQNMNVVASALRNVELTSLTIDPLPMEIFRVADERRHWFECARSFTSLSKLTLVMDSPSNLLPSSRFKAVNGLGHVLQQAPNLKHLSLAFQTYHSPLQKFTLSFAALLGDKFTFEQLSDLKIEGVSCAEDDIRDFLLRHAATLQRLRLGGRGLARPHEASIGGLHLHEGSFRSLFASLQGRLPALRRFHAEGDFQGGEMLTSSREVFRFHAVTEEDWTDIPVRSGGPRKTFDSRELERFLVKGGDYPRFVVPAE
jgi:hypothetical protein